MSYKIPYIILIFLAAIIFVATSLVQFGNGKSDISDGIVIVEGQYTASDKHGFADGSAQTSLPIHNPYTSSSYFISSPEGDDSTRARVSSQSRDFVWANKTEGDIGNALQHIPYLNKSALLEVICGETICEASGQIYSDASSYNRALAEEYIESMRFSENLRQANALANEVNFEKNTGKFTIYFSRVRK